MQNAVTLMKIMHIFIFLNTDISKNVIKFHISKENILNVKKMRQRFIFIKEENEI